MKYYIDSQGFLYIGDLQPGDRIATPEEVTEYFRDQRSYSEKRAAEYPDYREFLDAQVKLNSGDPELVTEGEAQQQAYIQACLEVKAKYPKSAEDS